MLFLMIFMVLIYRAFKASTLWSYALAGAALGAVLLIKSTAAVFVPCVFVYLAISAPHFAGIRRAFVATGILLLTATMVLSPWIIRNYELSGKFVPTMSVGGMAAYSGYYIATHRNTGREQWVLDLDASNEIGEIAAKMGRRFKAGYYPQFYTIGDELEFYTKLGPIVREKYRENPATFLKVLAFNAKGFWIQGRTRKATALNMVVVLPFLGLVAIGTVAGWRRRLPILPILLFVGAFYAAHVPILGQARYHVPLIPLLAILFCLVLQPVVTKRGWA
jgi:4-amino-4-deoxy-L-arabinose transferase-like glycosyltransferase